MCPGMKVFVTLERHYRESQSEAARSYIEEFMSSVPCQTCEGKRLRPESLAAAVSSKSIYEWTAMSVGPFDGICTLDFPY